jgi:putative glutamine amidotransferase
MIPIIAVTADRSEESPATGPNQDGRIRPVPARVHVSESVLVALKESRAEVIVLPPAPTDTVALVAWVMEHCHGLVITGGHFDIHPSMYGQEIEGRIDRVDAERTQLELALAQAAIEKDMPILGICGGMQVLAVAGGGSLIQDINTQVPGALEHEQSSAPSTPWHSITIEGGLLRKAYGCTILRVNSTHHQAIDDPGCFLITARAPDGIIEAIEHPDLRCCVGVQWHPEAIDPAPLRMLAWFAANPNG